MYCRRPYQDDTIFLTRLHSVHWKRYRLGRASSLMHVKNSANVLVAPDGSLSLSNPSVSQSGMYFCMQGKSVLSAWLLEIFAQSDSRMVGNYFRKKPIEGFQFKDYGLSVDYEWESWSPCSRC